MTSLIGNDPVKIGISKRTFLWLAAVGILAVLLALLTIAVEDVADRTQDIESMNWAMDGIVGWDLFGLTTFFNIVSVLTDAEAGIIYGALGITFLLLLGKTRPAIVFATVGLTIGAVAILGDATLGDLVDRGRPLDGSPNATPAFPSGHVFGSTVFFGFMGWLAIYYQVKRKILLPALVLFVAAIVRWRDNNSVRPVGRSLSLVSWRRSSNISVSSLLIGAVRLWRQHRGQAFKPKQPTRLPLISRIEQGVSWFRSSSPLFTLSVTL